MVKLWSRKKSIQDEEQSDRHKALGEQVARQEREARVSRVRAEDAAGRLVRQLDLNNFSALIAHSFLPRGKANGMLDPSAVEAPGHRETSEKQGE